jgi:subtilase family serine protease
VGRFRYYAMTAAVVLAGACTATIELVGPRAAAATPPPTATGLTSVGAAATLPPGTSPVGSLPSSTPLTLDLALKPRDPAALERYATAVSTPGSRSYRHYLARGQFASRFGPSAGTLNELRTGLQGLRLGRIRISQNHLILSIHTTAGSAGRALKTRLGRFKLPSGRIAYANSTPPMLPHALAPSIQAVVGLENVVRLSPSSGGRRAVFAPSAYATGATIPGPKPCANARATGAETADKLASAYGFAPLYSAGYLGHGEEIALFEAAAYSASDVKTYQACYHTATQVTAVSVDGHVRVGNGSLEATTDVEDLIGLAPQAHIRVYQTANSFEPNWLDEWTRIVDDDTADVVSTSWLGCEKYEPRNYIKAENTLLQQAATQGQTVVAASGDYGSEACDQFTGSTKLSVDDAASQPYATGVGGTQWKSATRPRVAEKTWNSRRSGASGGGLSSIWSMPGWQSAPGVVSKYSSGTPCKASAGYCREVPDVSALAGSPYYAFYCKAGDCSKVGGWGYFWGTSFATPLWAAGIALADEQCSASPRLGFLNPKLYALASSGSYATVLHDIKTGNNDFTRDHAGRYPATAGYDLATGLGTPLLASKSAPGLAAALCP